MDELVNIKAQAADRTSWSTDQIWVTATHPHQNTNTSIPYIARPNAHQFNVLLVPGSPLVSFQKNRPGRINETVVDPVAPTKERTVK